MTRTVPWQQSSDVKSFVMLPYLGPEFIAALLRMFRSPEEEQQPVAGTGNCAALDNAKEENLKDTSPETPLDCQRLRVAMERQNLE